MGSLRRFCLEFLTNSLDVWPIFQNLVKKSSSGGIVNEPRRNRQAQRPAGREFEITQYQYFPNPPGISVGVRFGVDGRGVVSFLLSSSHRSAAPTIPFKRKSRSSGFDALAIASSNEIIPCLCSRMIA